MKKKLYLGNLPFDEKLDTVTTSLKEAFSPFGDIAEISVLTDRYTKCLRGFGFITFTTMDEAEAALDMDGQELLGRKIRVGWANETEDKQATKKHTQGNI